jgi:hypothetical protein
MRSIASLPTSRRRHGSILVARVFVALLFFAGLSLAGCSKRHADRQDVHPVAGQVTYNGKPAAGALVVFHPQDPAVGELKPNARADQQGNYTLSTYSAGDGAPAGQYKVTVILRQLVKKEGDFEPGPNILPAQLSTPATSKIAAQVAEGPNTVPIKITR